MESFGKQWGDLEVDALAIGLDLKTFWELTPKEFDKYVKAYQKRRENEIRDRDFTNYLLGKYIGIAVNDPKKYPKKPLLFKEEKKEEVMSDEEMRKIMMANTLSLGGKINGRKAS
jgi:hypothetical protein